MNTATTIKLAFVVAIAYLVSRFPILFAAIGWHLIRETTLVILPIVLIWTSAFWSHHRIGERIGIGLFIVSVCGLGFLFTDAGEWLDLFYLILSIPLFCIAYKYRRKPIEE